MENNIVKVSLSIELQGSTAHVKQERVPIERTFFNKATKQKETKIYWMKLPTRVYSPVYQHLNIYEDAYKYFISNDAYKMSMNQWKKLTPKERLEFHLRDIANSFGSNTFTYEIVGD